MTYNMKNNSCAVDNQYRKTHINGVELIKKVIYMNKRKKKILLLIIVLLACVVLPAPVFMIVAGLLWLVASITGLSYNDVNVVLYFILIPLLWVVLVDLWLRKGRLWLFNNRVPWFTSIALIMYVLYICRLTWRSFADTTAEIGYAMCEWVLNPVESTSQIDIMGDGYVLGSVLLCVIAPVVITVCLIAPLYRWERQVRTVCAVIATVCVLALAGFVTAWLNGDAYATELVHRLGM